MDGNTNIVDILSLVGEFVIAGVFILAWREERQERQRNLKEFEAERRLLMAEVIDLAREAFGLQPRPQPRIVDLGQKPANDGARLVTAEGHVF